MQRQPANIYCIENSNNRNNQFIQLFKSIDGQRNHGKLVENKYFIIRSDIHYNGEVLFNEIQSNFNRRGYQYIMFSLSND